jgi:H+/Cl- antiporter ClcA/CBS domain-containing protein
VRREHRLAIFLLLLTDQSARTADERLPADSIGGADERSDRGVERVLGDFTLTLDALRLVPLALVVGAVAAAVALGLLDLIGLVTHLAYFGKVGTGLVQPSLHRFGAWTVLIPVAGGGAVGLMARYGSERIRGHGIPEAMETILIGGSKVEPRLTVLKPISSALSIGSCGPFGAEGPIFLTGGALGSVFAQFLHLTAIERRTLLVAGACGGMAAVFGTPLAAVLFGIELLVFEWKPRSMAPIAAAVVVASAIRDVFAHHGLIRAAPLFPVPGSVHLSSLGVLEAAALGLVTGALALALTTAVYGAEDAFKRLPIHWAWWPAIGGLVVGLGGLVDSRALGVGYGTIGDELAGRLALGALILLLVVKLVIWATALGSGTSGGILAPLLMMGAAAGGVLGHGFAGGTPATWAVLGMAGTLAGVTRSPFTSIVFAVELTHEQSLLLPLLATCTIAHLFSAATLKRSILTEKVARRGFHVMREYAVDPLEALYVREAMAQDIRVVPPSTPAAELRSIFAHDPMARRQRLYPIVDGAAGLVGVVGWSHLVGVEEGVPVEEVMERRVVVAYADEVLRTVASRMAELQLGAMPVVDRDDPRAVIGVVTEFELLAGRRRQLEEERRRERPLRLTPAIARTTRPVRRRVRARRSG